MVGRRKPIRAPFPDISNHIVQPELIGCECGNGRGGDIAVRRGVRPRKPALPDVAHMLIIRGQSTAPRIPVIGPCTRGVFPLCLGRQGTARPTAIGQRIKPGDMHNRMILALRQIGPLTFRRVPTSIRCRIPPRGVCRYICLVAPLRRGQEHVKNMAPALSLCRGAISRFLDKQSEITVRRRVSGNRIPRQLDSPDGSFAIFGVSFTLRCAHPELAARKLDKLAKDLTTWRAGPQSRRR